MIITQLVGGLGNQMFQYALGRRLALETWASLWLDLAWFGAEPGPTPRHYGLSHYSIRARELPSWLGNFLLPPEHEPSDRARRYFVSRTPERHLGFNPEVLESKGSVYLTGYWQNEQYFAPVADQIRADFRLAAPMTMERQAIAARMGEGSISVHVRRGDYVAVPEFRGFFGTCSPQWYREAIAQMAASVKNPCFFMFSDDPDWVRDNLQIAGESQFIDPQTDGRDFEDLWLMAKCRHHIIANSSFSWWGAWLNPSPDKIVVAPKVWFRGENPPRDRLPPSWIRL